MNAPMPAVGPQQGQERAEPATVDRSSLDERIAAAFSVDAVTSVEVADLIEETKAAHAASCEIAEQAQGTSPRPHRAPVRCGAGQGRNGGRNV